MQGTKSPKRFKSVAEYIEATGLKKGFVARRWGISSFQMTALIYPGRYRVALNEKQVAVIAQDLNQSVDDTRQILKFAIAA